MGEVYELSPARERMPAALTERCWPDPGSFGAWRNGVRQAVLTHVADFVAERCVELDEAGVDVAGDILTQFVSGGKCLRSTFMYLGWLAGRFGSDPALRAAASLELLHAFALLQDDVMDASATRRGRPAAHIQFSGWHRDSGLSGSSKRFGESAAILLGDLCLIWAEQMLRESGVAPRRLQQAWPRYDAMRTELALGQFADLASDARDLPTMHAVLDVARRKSGNYTVRRPLEIGAAMAGCGDRTMSALGRYGAAVGEAFQLRDDVLGVFGLTSTTGKPSGGDLIERKPTSVVMAAHQLADAPTRRQLTELMNSDDIDDSALDHWRALIVATGAVQWVEEMITSRVESARKELGDMDIDESVHHALDNMAVECTERSQ
ncbi:polyprenyl synthetase [Mycobacterium noviomagense]|uniref:Polyprenyl synthetase n=2 Tax=Mycobacterium noviomagense TaxID=459858 RepID=A0A7I7PGM9_9MYCO|nr:polyprenyl synthetase [Mycobacterium noviomagense]